jgi:hypothetical protein
MTHEESLTIALNQRVDILEKQVKLLMEERENNVIRKGRSKQVQGKSEK